MCVSSPLPDPLKIHTPRDNGGLGLPDPLHLFGGGAPGFSAAKLAAATPAPEAPTPSQGSQLPKQSDMRRALQVLAAGITGRPGSTNFTGPAGINPGLLNIGRNTLLGS